MAVKVFETLVYSHGPTSSSLVYNHLPVAASTPCSALSNASNDFKSWHPTAIFLSVFTFHCTSLLHFTQLLILLLGYAQHIFLRTLIIAYLLHRCITLCFLVVLGFWTQGLALARQVLLHLSHAPISFCFSYFLGDLLGLFAQASLYHDPSSWDGRWMPLCPALGWDEILQTCAWVGPKPWSSWSLAPT
jgi:hypothetical protein